MGAEELRILGEDALALYLWKPEGLPVFPPHADPAGDCLLHRLRAAGRGQGEWPAGFEGGLAHRLDNATSGLVVCARAPDALEELRARFRSGRLEKRYLLCSVSGGTAPRRCEAELAHHPRRADRMVVRRGPRTDHRGRWYPAQTGFEPLGGGWWRATMATGVMHQIRAHAAFVGLPLAGDPLYGPPGVPSPSSRVPFVLHHEGIRGPGWVTPTAPLSWRGDEGGLAPLPGASGARR